MAAVAVATATVDAEAAVDAVVAVVEAAVVMVVLMEGMAGMAAGTTAGECFDSSLLRIRTPQTPPTISSSALQMVQLIVRVVSLLLPPGYLVPVCMHGNLFLARL